MLRTTNSALFSSLTRFGLPVYGSGAYEAHLDRMETQHANVSAGRITGIGRSARLVTLRMTAGALSVRNQYIQACALLLDRSLRAYDSTIQTRLLRWTRRMYSVSEWHPPPTIVQPEHDAPSFRGLRGGELVVIPVQ